MIIFFSFEFRAKIGALDELQFKEAPNGLE